MFRLQLVFVSVLSDTVDTVPVYDTLPSRLGYSSCLCQCSATQWTQCLSTTLSRHVWATARVCVCDQRLKTVDTVPIYDTLPSCLDYSLCLCQWSATKDTVDTVPI